MLVLLYVNGSFTWHILLCSLFLISVDLRMPLVSHGLFNSFFCLLDAIWSSTQKFTNFSTCFRNSLEDKSTPLWLKCSSVTQSTFSSRELTLFLFFFNLLEVPEHFLCAVKFKWAVLLSHYQKLSMIVWQWFNKISRNKRRIVVIGDYIVWESCWWCCSASWVENVWKDKGWVH